MKKILLALAMLATLLTPAIAGDFTVRGVGLAQCKDWTHNDHTRFKTVEQWVLAFVSGVSDAQGWVNDSISNDNVTDAAYKFCHVGKNGSATIAEAAQAAAMLLGRKSYHDDKQPEQTSNLPNPLLEQ